MRTGIAFCASFASFAPLALLTFLALRASLTSRAVELTKDRKHQERKYDDRQASGRDPARSYELEKFIHL